MFFEYVSLNSPIHRLDVRTKSAFLFCFTTLSLLFFNPIHLFTTFIFAMIFALFAQVPILRVYKKIIIPTLMVPLSMLLFASFTYGVPDQPNLQIANKILFDVGKVPLLGYLQLTVAGIIVGINFGLKMFIMVFASITVLYSTQLEDFFYLFNMLHFPYAISFIITTALRLFPTISNEMETTKQAQISRGSNLKAAKGVKERVMGGTALLVPALVGAWRRSENLALAMVSRGFSASEKRTFLREPKMATSDYIIFALLISITSILIYLKITRDFGAL